MVRKNKESFGFKAYFLIFLLLGLVINFTGAHFGLTMLSWHLFLHSGIIVFSILVLIYSLKLNEKAAKYIVVGSILWVIVNCILFLSDAFKGYSLLDTNLFIFLGMIVGGLFLVYGFKEAVNV